MNNSTIHSVLHIFFHNIQRILRGIAAMNHKRKLFLAGNVHLLAENLLLKKMLLFFLMPVIIQADLTHCHSFFHVAISTDLIQNSYIHLIRIIRMHTHGAVNGRIFLHQVINSVKMSHRSTHIHNMPDPILLHTIQHGKTIFVKSLIIIMGMSIKNHPFIHSHLISHRYFSTFQHSCKHTFPGHDALTHLLKNSTAIVALLSDLSQLQHNFATAKSGTNRKLRKINPLHNQILTKSTILNLCTLCTERIDLFTGKKTHLPVPLPGMSISLKSPVLHKNRRPHISLLSPLLLTDTNRKYFSHNKTPINYTSLPNLFLYHTSNIDFQNLPHVTLKPQEL